MSILSRLTSALGLTAPARKSRPLPPQIRLASAGRTDRLNAAQPIADLSVNAELFRHLKVARARATGFLRDSEYGRRYLSLLLTNVVGPNGFALAFQPKREDGTIDQLDADRLNAAYKRWSLRENCHVGGKHSFLTLQRLIVANLARTGECFIQEFIGPRYGAHGYQIHIIPSRLCDERLNKDLGSGRRIRLGVELDESERRLAYWFKKPAALDVYGATETIEHVRVPADEVHHLYLCEEDDQLRGVPWAAASVRSAFFLDDYDEAAITAARGGAAKMGFFKTQGDGEVGAEAIADTKERGEFISESEPGHWTVLPPGWDFQNYDPDYPHAAYEPFVKVRLRRLAAGLNVAYASISNDRTADTFSSIRTGTVDERDVWKAIQGFIIDDLLNVVVTRWLYQAMIYDPDLRRLPQEKFDKFNAFTWTPRRWDWVDPKADILAMKEARAMRLTSTGMIIRERGLDPEKVWAEIEAEDARFGPPAAPASSSAKPDQENEDEQKD